MNTPKVTGRRFSKVRVIKIGPVNKDRELEPADISELDKHLAEERPRSLPEVLGYYVEFSRSRLQSSGLPSDPVVTWTDAKPRRGEHGPQSCKASLPAYVINEWGYEADSPEGLAAKIIWEAHQLETAQAGETRDLMLFNLGKLWTLFRVNSMTSAGASKGGKRGTPRPNRTKVTDEVLTELKKLEAKNKSGAAGIVAKKHGFTASAIRAAKKKKSET